MHKLFRLKLIIPRNNSRVVPSQALQSKPPRHYGHRRHGFSTFTHEQTVVHTLSSIWRRGSQKVLQKLQELNNLAEIERMRVAYKLRPPHLRWSPITNGVTNGLIATNVVVYLLWKVADEKFMIQNFTLQLDNIKSGAFHTMITSAFSHKSVLHIGSNMIGLYLFGKTIEQCVGPAFMLKLYLAGAFVGSAFYLVDRAFLASRLKGSQLPKSDPSKLPALGASAAVSAIVMLHIFLFPKEILLVEFVIPVPAILAGIYIVWKDIKRVKENSRISGSAHLGGTVVAIITWARLRKRL